MWNLKRLTSVVFCTVNRMFGENVKMASKNVPATEKPKVSRKGFFQRSESVMSDSYEKNLTADAVNVDSDKRVIRRSSMICSEGFDKYTFDCHRRDIPSRSVGLELDATAISDEPTQNKSSPVPENATYLQSSKSTPIEYSAGKPVSFKPLSPLSATVKNAPLPFKRVPEETIPFNIPSYKRVPEETIPVAKPYSNISSDKSPVTNIPFLFNPIPEESGWTGNTSKTSSNKSAPVRSTPFSFRHVSGDSTPTRNTPLSFKCISEETPAVKALSFRSASGQFALTRNKPLSFEEASEEYTPARNVPLSFKHVPDKTISKSNISTQAISEEFTPARNVPLSLKHVPDKGISKNFISSQAVSDEFIPHRNSPLSLKYVPSENASSKKTHTSLRFFSKPSTPRDRDISLPFQSVPEEPVHGSHPLSYKDVPDEPIPARNSPLSLKPLLSKHISLLKKKSPSVKSPIIKRDSVVHPGRIDMQSSLCIDGRFQNPWPTWRPPTFTNILKFGVTRNKSKVPPKQELDLVLPIVKKNFSKLTIPDDGIQVTWIGHSTVLVQMHGLNILTDPMFSDRASPSQVVGPKRYRDPPCSIHDLPHINAVVISHSHYDHLDYNTITLLNARFGTDIRWFVPLGLQTWMEHVGCENVVELDWWEENCVPEHSDTFFVFTPAQHWSKRTIGDDNKVLWGSWCVLGPKYRFFFAGDTGYCDVFKQIGRIHGPFDFSAIPIGAYEPRWFMKYQHVNPEEAVKIHMDVKSKKSLAIHWGTFCLANEYYLDPPVKLRDSLDKYEIPPELFFTLKHGDSKLIAQNNLVKRYPLSDKNSNNS